MSTTNYPIGSPGRWEAYRAEERKEGDAMIAAAKPILATHAANGITEIVLRYDGEGDSGSIESIVFLNSNSKPRSPTLVEGTVEALRNEEPPEQSVDDHKELVGVVYALLERQDFDWINNDGGYGEIHIFPATGKATIEHNQRISDTEYSEHEENLFAED